MKAIRLPALILAGVLTLTACGGDDSAETPATTAGATGATQTTAAAGDTTTSETGVTTVDNEPGASGSETTLTSLEPTAPQGGTDIPENIPPEQEPYYQEFTVDQGNTQITWDRWWWGLVDGKGLVQVIADGEVIVEGTISGPDSVMGQDDDGTTFFIGPDGSIVASVTQAELTETIQEYLAANGIS